MNAYTFSSLYLQTRPLLGGGAELDGEPNAAAPRCCNACPAAHTFIDLKPSHHRSKEVLQEPRGSTRPTSAYPSDVTAASRFLALAVVAFAVVGCGSTELRATRTVTNATGSGVERAGTAIVLSFRRADAWAVRPHGSLILLRANGSSTQVGSVPSPDPQTGVGYADSFGFAVDPDNAATFYLDSDALYVSHDGGRKWLGTGHDAGGKWDGQVLALGSIVYALRAPTYCTSDGYCGPGVWRLYASTDRGLTWRRVAQYDANEIWAITQAHQPGAIFVATATGLYLHRPGRPDVERDAGIHRSYGYQPSVVLIAASGRDRAVLYTAMSSGDNDDVVQIYASADQGRQWHLRRSPFHGASGLLLGDPTRPTVAYAVVNAPPTGKQISADTYRAQSKIFKTADSANSWREIWHGCQLVQGGTIDATPAKVLNGRPDTILIQNCNGMITRIRA